MKGLILIPFRHNNERAEQLDKLLTTIVNTIKLDYHVCHDDSQGLFNKGLLLNKGFLANMANYDYAILHDVDLCPDDQLIPYYHMFPESPMHLGYRGQRWSVDWTTKCTFLGGILSISKDHFEKVNGFPNDFYGWGGEDDALRDRLLRNSITPVYPPVGSVYDMENLSISEKLRLVEGIKNINKKQQLLLDRITWQDNGLSCLR